MSQTPTGFAVQWGRFAGGLRFVAAAQKNPGFPESGPTTIFRLTRINQELLDESGPHQTTPESNTGQVTTWDTGTSSKS
ncbi:unnamed protein product [marine sediment metagenome]|uniref:Uncharacterized protein n=1 Tax=marine sediment metagenome TaxID=412755 RepID=X1SP63_9ZZZZ